MAVSTFPLKLLAGFARALGVFFFFSRYFLVQISSGRLWQRCSKEPHSEASSKIHCFLKAWEIIIFFPERIFVFFSPVKKENHRQEFSINANERRMVENTFPWDLHNEKKVQMVRGLKDWFLWCLAIFQAPRVRFYLLIRSAEYSRHMTLSHPFLMPQAHRSTTQQRS